MKNKRNTNAVDVGNGMLVAARVAEFKAASLRAFEGSEARDREGLETDGRSLPRRMAK